MKITIQLQKAALAHLEDGFEIVYSTRADRGVTTFKLEDMLSAPLGSILDGTKHHEGIDIVNAFANIKFIGVYQVRKPPRRFNQCVTYRDFVRSIEKPLY